MLTERGLAAIAAALAERLSDGQIVVSNGDGESDGASIESATVDGNQVVVTATFGEDKANFSWQEKMVVVGGEAHDRETADMGTKPQGAVWTVSTTIDLLAS